MGRGQQRPLWEGLGLGALGSEQRVGVGDGCFRERTLGVRGGPLPGEGAITESKEEGGATQGKSGVRGDTAMERQSQRAG